MNKHFEDARYYLRRAVEHVRLGVEETLEPAVGKARELTGREAEPEPSRVDSVLEEVKAVESRAEDRLEGARDRLESYRPSR